MTPDDFITRMTVLYGPPDTIDNEMFLDEYRDVLKGNDARILKRAGDIIRDTQVRRFWPTPAEVKEAIKKAAFHFSSYVPAEHQKFEPASVKPEWTPEDEAREIAAKARVDMLAKAFLKAMRANTVVDKQESIDASRDKFSDMQRNSPNRFHRRH